MRRAEFRAATRLLRLKRVTLLGYPDGHLAKIPRNELVTHVLTLATDADALLVFDEGGVTGHADHCAATKAALAAADILDLPVFAWALPRAVAERLNAEFSTSFVGRNEDELDMVMEVNRTQQLAAIACHCTQSTNNVVLWRRLELLGRHEWLRCLRPSTGWPLLTVVGSGVSQPVGS